MEFPINKFFEMLEHAAEIGHEPTAWEVGHGAAKDIICNTQADRRLLSMGPPAQPMKFYGIDVLERSDLPNFRVVLLSGKNTLGAFDTREP